MLTALAVAATFNLVCTGTKTIGELTKFTNDHPPFTRTLRVDLDNMRWCEDECNSTKPIKGLIDNLIVLDLKEDPGKSVFDANDAVVQVNRESGEYLDRVRTSGFVFMYTGHCEKAPFTGFPAFKF